MKILITGGAGYLGSVMTKNLLDLGHEITVLDSLLFKQISPLTYTNNKKYNFIYGDVRNEELLTKLVKSHDVIIPLAAIVGFPACKSDPKSAWDINHNQIIDIVEIISKDQLILYPNTNSGYGVGYGIKDNQTECTEESSLKPISVYG
jgi:nucleoside-diphosphate-sugar epimerase